MAVPERINLFRAQAHVLRGFATRRKCCGAVQPTLTHANAILVIYLRTSGMWFVSLGEACCTVVGEETGNVDQLLKVGLRRGDPIHVDTDLATLYAHVEARPVPRQ